MILRNILTKHVFEGINMLTIAEIETMAEPMFVEIGLEQNKRDTFTKCMLNKGKYCIDASEILKELGIIAINAYSDKIQRCLVSANLIEKDLILTDMNIIDILLPPYKGEVNITNNDKFGPIYKNKCCIIIRCEGGYRKPPSYQFMITKRAFQKILDRSRNDDRFADYFALKIEIHEICKDYQSKHKDIKIERYENTMKELNDSNRKLAQKIDSNSAQQNKKIDQLIGHVKDIKCTLDFMVEFITSFAHAVLPMWVGSGVMKTQLTNLLNQNEINSLKQCEINYALVQLKFAYAVGFYNEDTLIVYFCCTNFKNVPDRIRPLKKKYSDMNMLIPQAICLVSCEINTEIATIRNTCFDEIITEPVNYNSKSKAFIAELDELSNVHEIYHNIVEKFRSKRLQPYQMRMDEILQKEEVSLSDEVLSYLHQSDNSFFANTLPFCQAYLECYINKSDNKIAYTPSKTKTERRSDLNDLRLTDRMYAMHKIKQLIDIDHEDDNHEFNRMVQEGIITSKDKATLKKIAEVEHVDISNLHEPSSDEESD